MAYTNSRYKNKFWFTFFSMDGKKIKLKFTVGSAGLTVDCSGCAGLKCQKD